MPRANRGGDNGGTLRGRRRRKATSLLRAGRVNQIPPCAPANGETVIFRDRRDAGRQLALKLGHLKGKDVVVLGIPRGGVVVAEEVAKALGATLDIVVTKKIEAPGEPEFALGAVTQEGEVLMDRQAAEL